MNKIKRTIIKRAMKLCENVPTSDSLSLSEIFRHKSFTEASEEERERIMLKSSEFRYFYELQYPFDLFFGLDLAPLLNGRVVLDLGCFTGGKSVAWAERYRLGKIYGIDVEDVFIKAARNFAQKKGIKAEFVCGKGGNLPFRDGKFDAILSHDVFEHVQNLEQVLFECNRVLKKNGKLFVVFPSYFNPIEHHLSLVTRTPFIHYFVSGRELVDVYNEIIDERGEEANWYKRPSRHLEPWERCQGINGTTKAKFRHLLSDSNWDIYYERNLPLFRIGSIPARYPFLKSLGYAITPFAQVRRLEEFLCHSIVYILEKRGLGDT